MILTSRPLGRCNTPGSIGGTRLILHLLSIALLGLLWLWPAGASAGSKVDELRRKTADITLLQQQLQDRIRQAEKIRTALLDQQRRLMDEIQLLRKQNNITDLTRAEQMPRIHYNIELLRSMMAYIDFFDDKISHFQTGWDKLSYLQRLIEDDIKMISALSDLKVDALTTQISLVVNRYLPDAHIIQIDPAKIEPLSAQAVWDAVLRERA